MRNIHIHSKTKHEKRYYGTIFRRNLHGFYPNNMLWVNSKILSSDNKNNNKMKSTQSRFGR